MLKGKVALVTGSTSGIGLGIARRLAAAGADLMLNGFGDAVEIEKLRSGLAKEFGVRVAFASADIGKAEEAAGMVASAQSQLGRLDILVNNAGIQFVSPVETFPIDKWNAVIAINLSGAFYAIRAVLPGMKSRGYGRIINIASAHGLVASKEKSAYVAAKHGILGLTKVVALENAEADITCNAICPAGCSRRWCRSRSTSARRTQASRSSRRNAIWSARSSPTCALRRLKRSATLQCSSAGQAAARSPALRCRSTAAGPLSNDASASARPWTSAAMPLSPSAW